MNFKNEATSMNLEARKLGALLTFISDERDKWKAQYGQLQLDSAEAHMVRDHDILLEHMTTALGQVMLTVRDILTALDEKST